MTMPKLNLVPTARDQFRSNFDDLRHKDAEMPATLGDGQGNVRIDQTHSWARVGENRTVMQVWNDRVPHIDGWEVVVGYEPGQNLFRVLRGREPYESRAYSLFGEHGASHSMFHPDGGHDVAWIDIRQWMPLRVFPSSTFTVSVWWGMIYRDGAWDDIEIQTFDLSSYQPADGALYVLVTLDADGVLMATAGASVADKDSLLSSDIPAVPSGHYPLAAVRLYDNQTAILERRDDTDIVDLRYPPYTTMAPASATGGVAWENIIVVAESGGDYSSLVSAVSAAVSGDEILVAPIPALAENVTAKAGVSVISMSAFPDNIVLSPAAGVPLTIPSGGGSFLFHGLHFSPPSGQVAVVAASGATGGVSLHRCRLGVNGADSLSLSVADAALVVYARECTVDGNITTKAALTLYNCLVTGNVTQSTGAGALTIEGGNIDGNLTTVAGSTITLRNLPRIVGTVSGAGTLVGAYLTATGEVRTSDSFHARLDGSGGGYFAGANSDVQLYRDSLDWWRTPDNVIIDGVLLVGTTATFGTEYKVQISADSPIYYSAAAYTTAVGDAAAWVVRRARGSEASPANVSSGDLIGSFQFDMRAGGGFFPAASLRAYVDGTPDASDYPSRIELYTTPDGSDTQVLGATLKNTGQWQLPVTGVNAGILIGGDALLYRSAASVLAIGTGTTLHNQISSIASTATIFNETGVDIDFRIEGDNEVNLFFADASADAVGIGTASPSARLHVRKDQNATTAIQVENATAGTGASIDILAKNDLGDTNALGIYSSTTNALGIITSGSAYLFTVAPRLAIAVNDASGVIVFGTGTSITERMRIDVLGNVGINTSTFGTSAAGILGIANAGVVPGSSPANMIQIYSKDSSAGSANATLAVRTEQAVEAIGTFTASHKLRVWINEVEYHLSLDAV